MKHFILFFVCILNCIGQFSYSQNQLDISDNIGFRVFSELNYTISLGRWGVEHENHFKGLKDKDGKLLGFSIDHIELNVGYGCQFHPNLFLGFGTGIHCYAGRNSENDENGNPLVDKDGNVFMVPLFTDFRVSLPMGGKIIPFAGAKLGYSFDASYNFNGVGMYIVPSIGIKFMPLNDNKTMNFSLGYTNQLDSHPENRYNHGETRYRKTDNYAGVSLIVGLEF